jgi:hypothetical protein
VSYLSIRGIKPPRKMEADSTHMQGNSLHYYSSYFKHNTTSYYYNTVTVITTRVFLTMSIGMIKVIIKNVFYKFLIIMI